MASFWDPPTRSSHSDPQIISQTDNALGAKYVTKDDLDAYIRSNSFRSIMQNQNADLYEFGKWQEWEPDLLATVTKPSLGDAGYIRGRYTRIGDTVICNFGIKFSPNASAGSGYWSVTLPVVPNKPSISSRSDLNPYAANIYDASYQGTFFAQQWSRTADPVIPGRIFWGSLAIATDPATGDVKTPPTAGFIMGYLSGPVGGAIGGSGGGYNPAAGEPTLEKLTFQYSRQVDNSWPWYLNTPTTNTVITGNLVYEAKPSDDTAKSNNTQVV